MKKNKNVTIIKQKLLVILQASIDPYVQEEVAL